MKKEVLIFGAGKIGRGFIAHLFYRSGYKLWFVDASNQVVELLNKEGKYRIDIAKAEQDLTEYIEVAGAFTLEENDKVADVFDQVDIIVSSVGATNIEKVTQFIRELLRATNRSKLLNWIICENAVNPSKKIRDLLLQDGDVQFANFVDTQLGIIETQVLRTGMPAKEEVISREPLAVRMQDWWTLPLDKDAFVGPIPNIQGFDPRPNFSNELIRKLYTFNGTNAAIAYVGWANGFNILHESALAFPGFFKAVQEEAAFGVINEFGLDEKEQRNFMATAMKKYTDPNLNDKIERNANDSRRKVAYDERLIGPALLCLKHGSTPNAYAKAIAAAYYYKGSRDEGTLAVQQTIQESGIEAAITTYSLLDSASALYQLVLESYRAKDFIFNKTDSST